ncbi:hypothetical protein EPN18_06825 [bacterium]|nr:MAG: hypothetical protein EPN18_06825 [bacterium]
MRDAVAIVIGRTQYANFVSYEADSNVLVPADVFSCKISRVDAGIMAGEKFQLIVNGSREMTGIIDKVSAQYSKGALELRVEGRDYMGLLVDSSVEQWQTWKDATLKDMAPRLLKHIPYIKNSKVIYGNEKEDTGMRAKKTKKETSKGIFDDTSSGASHYEAGISVFEALSDYSQRHGLLMWMEPDGTLVFGELKGKGDAPEFSFFTRKSGQEKAQNNIISATLTDDISKRFSALTVVAQQQGTDFLDAGRHDIKKTAVDDSFPYKKPLVIQSQCAGEKAAGYQAQWELKKREADGWRAELTVAGHGQNGNNYRANSVCYVKDEVLSLDGNYLILGRRFTMDVNSGPRTMLTIGKLMEGYSVQ